MAKKLLNAAQIGSTGEQLRGKRVPHGVRGERRVEPGLSDMALEHDAKGIGAHAPAPRRNEQSRVVFIERLL